MTYLEIQLSRPLACASRSHSVQPPLPLQVQPASPPAILACHAHADEGVCRPSRATKASAENCEVLPSSRAARRAATSVRSGMFTSRASIVTPRRSRCSASAVLRPLSAGGIKLSPRAVIFTFSRKIAPSARQVGAPMPHLISDACGRLRRGQCARSIPAPDVPRQRDEVVDRAEMDVGRVVPRYKRGRWCAACGPRSPATAAHASARSSGNDTIARLPMRSICSSTARGARRLQGLAQDHIVEGASG